MKCKFSKIAMNGCYRGKGICVSTEVRCDGEEKDRKDCPLWSKSK